MEFDQLNQEDQLIYCYRAAYIRLLTINPAFLAPWQAHFASQQRFIDYPNDP